MSTDPNRSLHAAHYSIEEATSLEGEEATSLEGQLAPRRLRLRLIATDVLTSALAWGAVAIAVGPPFYPSSHLSTLVALTWAMLGVLVTVACLDAQKLYLARVASVGPIEMQRVARAVAVSAAVAAAGVWAWGLDPSLPSLAAASLANIVFISLGRSIFRLWLTDRRTNGAYVRPVLIGGTNADAAELCTLFREHPEFGYRPIGFLGSEDSALEDCSLPVLGDYDQALSVIRATSATGVFIVANSMTTSSLNNMSRRLSDAGVHVHLFLGLRGVAYSRLRPQPLAREPLFYLEPIALSALQLRVKRLLDLSVGSAALVLTSPLLLLAALAIKVEGPGGILYRQRRIGRHGQPFTMYKFRTMVLHADRHVHRNDGPNMRTDGPLFKLVDDPRVTRVGQLLRATSIDELPQLVNVISGRMSLVGPRPALPHEVADFPADMLRRADVPPGMTGLWQLDARDNPHFAAYRRLDLFYVDNWSLGLDSAILLGTVLAVGNRALRALPGTLRSSVGTDALPH